MLSSMSTCKVRWIDKQESKFIVFRNRSSVKDRPTRKLSNQDRTCGGAFSAPTKTTSRRPAIYMYLHYMKSSPQ